MGLRSGFCIRETTLDGAQTHCEGQFAERSPPYLIPPALLILPHFCDAFLAVLGAAAGLLHGQVLVDGAVGQARGVDVLGEAFSGRC